MLLTQNKRSPVPRHLTGFRVITIDRAPKIVATILISQVKWLKNITFLFIEFSYLMKSFMYQALASRYHKECTSFVFIVSHLHIQCNAELLGAVLHNHTT